MAVRLRTANLIVNPDAELGPSAADYSSAAAPQGWTTTGNFTAVDYSIGGADQLNTADSATVVGEQSFFAGGPNNSASSITQRIDVSAFAAQIDSYPGDTSLVLRNSGFFGGFGTENDRMTMTVREVSAEGATLLEGTLGGLFPVSRGDVSSLVVQFQEMVIVPGTRFIDVFLTAEGGTGTYNDGYADNLSITLGSQDGAFGEYVEIDGNANPVIFTGETMPAAIGIVFVEQVFGGMTGIFAADQFGPGKLALNAQIVSSAKPDTVIVQLSSDQTFSAAAFRFDDGRWQDGIDFVRLEGSAGAETMTGTIKSDILDGGAGNDTFHGGAGDDQMNGGSGLDTAIFAGNHDLYTLQRMAGAVLVGGPDGVATLVSVEHVQFADASITVAKPDNDFNDDGRSDILFSQDGGVFASNYEWQLNDRAISGQGAIDLYDREFSVQVIGDYDGDGKADVLFQNPTTGGVWAWLLDGTTIVSQGAVDVGDPSFHLLGSADFNGDHKDDLLFRNDAGFVFQWQMNGLDNTPLPVQALDPAWHVVGAGDFDGDGKADILLRNIGGAANENGAFFLWKMDGNAVVGGGGIERPGTDWVTLGTGDFDGDGKTDFAVRNVSDGPDNGAVWVYLMNGTAITSQGAAGIADAATWHLQQIGDFNGDGKDDILYRNDAGYFYSWDMNGATIASEGLLQGDAQWAPPNLAVVTQHWDVV